MQSDEILHKLNDSWCMWFMYYDHASSWKEQNLQPVYEFDTVENFWGLYYRLKSPIDLKNGRDLCLFKSGIKPIWEDKINVAGGSWAIQLKHENRCHLSDIWEEILLFTISNTVDENDEDLNKEICGVAVNVRGKTDRISLWTQNCSEKNSILKIGRKLKSWLNYGAPLNYYSHADMKNKNFDKPLYSLND